MKEKLYEEVGSNYRYFLSWRHAAFAGILIIIYGVISLTALIYKEHPNIAFCVPLVASPIGILLWMIDLRTRNLYHAAIKAGKELEGDTKGFYTILSDEVVLGKKDFMSGKVSHSGALSILFFGFFILLLVLAVFLCRLTTG